MPVTVVSSIVLACVPALVIVELAVIESVMSAA